MLAELYDGMRRWLQRGMPYMLPRLGRRMHVWLWASELTEGLMFDRIRVIFGPIDRTDCDSNGINLSIVRPKVMRGLTLSGIVSDWMSSWPTWIGTALLLVVVFVSTRSSRIEIRAIGPLASSVACGGCYLYSGVLVARRARAARRFVVDLRCPHCDYPLMLDSNQLHCCECGFQVRLIDHHPEH